MASKLVLSYDREGDILHIEIDPPHGSPVFSFLEGDIVARCHPETGAVDHIDIPGFSTRLQSLDDTVEVPVTAEMTLNPGALPCD